MKSLLSFILKMLILFSIIFIFFQFVSVIEGTSSILQGVLSISSCAFFANSASKFDNLLQTKHIKIAVSRNKAKPVGIANFRTA